jgi:hypothetical protein
VWEEQQFENMLDALLSDPDPQLATVKWLYTQFGSKIKTLDQIHLLWKASWCKSSEALDLVYDIKTDSRPVMVTMFKVTGRRNNLPAMQWFQKKFNIVRSDGIFDEEDNVLASMWGCDNVLGIQWLHNTYGLTVVDIRDAAHSAMRHAFNYGFIKATQWIHTNFGLCMTDIKCQNYGKGDTIGGPCPLHRAARRASQENIPWLFTNLDVKTEDVYALPLCGGRFNLLEDVCYYTEEDVKIAQWLVDHYPLPMPHHFHFSALLDLFIRTHDHDDDDDDKKSPVEPIIQWLTETFRLRVCDIPKVQSHYTNRWQKWIISTKAAIRARDKSSIKVIL